jgi:hypothetical protein
MKTGNKLRVAACWGLWKFNLNKKGIPISEDFWLIDSVGLRIKNSNKDYIIYMSDKVQNPHLL